MKSENMVKMKGDVAVRWSPETEAICRAVVQKTASITHRALVAVIIFFFFLGNSLVTDDWLGSHLLC